VDAKHGKVKEREKIGRQGNFDDLPWHEFFSPYSPYSNLMSFEKRNTMVRSKMESEWSIAIKNSRRELRVLQWIENHMGKEAEKRNSAVKRWFWWSSTCWIQWAASRSLNPFFSCSNPRDSTESFIWRVKNVGYMLTPMAPKARTPREHSLKDAWGPVINS
jgi:hypothetical protein